MIIMNVIWLSMLLVFKILIPFSLVSRMPLHYITQPYLHSMPIDFYLTPQADFKLSGKRLDCTEINPHFFINITCNIKLVNRDVQSYTVDTWIIKDHSFDWIHVCNNFMFNTFDILCS